MKNLIFLIALIGNFSINLMAQEINFTFNPKDAANTIDSIRAINISTGKTVFVSGSNVISLSSSTTGINKLGKRLGNFTVFPNPFENNTELQFYTEQNDNIKVFLTNSLGQIVAMSNQHVTSGAHSFKITINSEGLYIVSVVGNQFKLSQKIIASGNMQNSNTIEYQGITSRSTIEKSKTIEDAAVIHFMVYSGDKITKIADAPTGSKTYDVEFIECKDADGRNYPIVQIGEQWWMAENLAYLPSIYPPFQYSELTPCYYVYDYYGTFLIDAKASYGYSLGVFYNWVAAKDACPKGWHIPTYNEWNELAHLISNEKEGIEIDKNGNWINLGKYLKTSTGWELEGSGNGLDSYGFSGYGGGTCSAGYSSTGNNGFGGEGEDGRWWTSTFIEEQLWAYELFYGNQNLKLLKLTINKGLYVRCIKD